MIFEYNKRGGEKILSIWWFAVLAIVGATIVVGVVMVYSADVDTRGLESSILAERVSNCIVSDGVLKPGLVGANSGKFDFFSECGLDKNFFEQSGLFYVEVNIKNLSGSKLSGPFDVGAAALKEDCLVTKKILARNYPKCVSKTGNVIYNGTNGKVAAIAEVFAASNQRG
jgi:hypothetical protein